MCCCISRIDLVVHKISLVKNTWLNCGKNCLELYNIKLNCPQNWLSQKKKKLDAKIIDSILVKSTQFVSPFTRYTYFWLVHPLFTGSILFESVLRQLGQSSSNRLGLLTRTIATHMLFDPTYWTCAVMQSVKNTQPGWSTNSSALLIISGCTLHKSGHFWRCNNIFYQSTILHLCMVTIVSIV